MRAKDDVSAVPDDTGFADRVRPRDISGVAVGSVRGLVAGDFADQKSGRVARDEEGRTVDAFVVTATGVVDFRRYFVWP